MSNNFTPQQLKDYEAYVKVQKSLRFNMLDPRAAAATGLSRDRFLFVLDNYEALSEAVKEAK